MATIQVTPELLNGKAAQLRQLKASHDEAMARVAAIVGGLSDVWRGEAQVAYVEKFQSMRGAIDSFSGMIEEYACFMDKAANAMAETDASLKAGMAAAGQ